MTEAGFRRIALGFPDTAEGAHMGHPDFRVNGRIFATLHGNNQTGMVALTPEQQGQFVREQPAAFEPGSGAWGRQGSTRVQLAAVGEDVLGEAMTLAWQNAVAKGATKKRTPKRSAKRAAAGRARSRR